MTFGLLLKQVENWFEFALYYLFPIHKKPLMIRFKDGSALVVPKSYICEAIAETLLLNVYNFPNNCSHLRVAVDIGASIGDFVLYASKAKHVRVYAFEPNYQAFQYLRINVSINQLDNVRIFNLPANRLTLQSIFECGEVVIDFLKIDCEGCEYDTLLNCSQEILSKVHAISMEIHHHVGYTQRELIRFLKRSGFRLKQSSIGQGHYLYARRS